MSISMYSASVPLFNTMLGALRGVLDKGEAHATARKFDPALLLALRLAPDMFPLVRQVQIACDGARGGAYRLAGEAVPSVPDDETSFEQLRDRIDSTLEHLKKFTPAQIDGSEEREIVLQMRAGEMRFTGQRFLLGFVIPNFTFHCATAYGILRHAGVEIGKRDFLGSF